jgi:hypothetical protein
MEVMASPHQNATLSEASGTISNKRKFYICTTEIPATFNITQVSKYVVKTHGKFINRKKIETNITNATSSMDNSSILHDHKIY